MAADSAPSNKVLPPAPRVEILSSPQLGCCLPDPGQGPSQPRPLSKPFDNFLTLLSVNQVPVAKPLGRFLTLGEDLVFPGLGGALSLLCLFGALMKRTGLGD